MCSSQCPVHSIKIRCRTVSREKLTGSVMYIKYTAEVNGLDEVHRIWRRAGANQKAPSKLEGARVNKFKCSYAATTAGLNLYP